MKEVRKTLNELGFVRLKSDEDSYCKDYKTFKLLILILPDRLIAALKIGSLEISLPNLIDEYWIIDFDNRNKIELL